MTESLNDFQALMLRKVAEAADRYREAAQNLEAATDELAAVTRRHGMESTP